MKREKIGFVSSVVVKCLNSYFALQGSYLENGYIKLKNDILTISLIH